MPAVSSSLLYSLDYDDERKIVTAVFKTNGAVWEYGPTVPKDIFDSVIGSGSVGSSFLNQIKPAYPARQVA